MSRFRFKLRSLLIALTVASMAAWYVSGYFQPDPVYEIINRKEWNEASRTGRIVLFVDGHWNADMAAFNRTYAAFARAHRYDSHLRTLRMTIDSNIKSEIPTICEELWRENSILPGGMKNRGGAGRVVWFDNGRVVDHAWCSEFLNGKDLDDTDALEARTKLVFEKTAERP